MGHSGLIDSTGRVKDDARRRGLGIGLTLHRHRHFLKHAIDQTDVEVHMPVQAGAEAVDVDLGFCQGDGPNVQRRLVHTCRTRAMVLQALRYHPQENAQHHTQHCPVTLQKKAQSLWY